MKKLLPIVTSLAAVVMSLPASAIVINTTNNSTILSNTILGSGLSVLGTSYSGDAASSGTFSGGFSSGLGMDSGIILTTGTAADAVGPNSLSDTTTITGSGGDADLQTLSAGQIYDATSLSIDFTSNGGNVFFNYAFASEEYNEYVGSEFNDVFGLFLDGVNISNVPGTGLSVAINNVNNGLNSQYYNDNELFDPFGESPPLDGPLLSTSDVTPYDIEYDGFTDVFTASFFGLSAGVHTLKFAIGDVSDSVLDSAIFIQGGTFGGVAPPSSVPVPAAVWLFGSGLLGLVGIARRKA